MNIGELIVNQAIESIGPQQIEQKEAIEQVKLEGVKHDIQWKSYIQEQNIGQTGKVYYLFEYVQYQQDGDEITQTVIHEFRRRYTHFRWLKKELELQNFGRIVPSIPEKGRTYDKDKRKHEFVHFLQKLLNHPVLQHAECLIKFIMETKMDKFQAYVDSSLSSKQEDNMLNTVYNTGAQVLGYVANLFKRAPLQLTLRVPDAKDAELDKIYQQMLLDKNAFTFIYLDVETIINKINQQAACLVPADLVFVPDCQTNTNKQKLQQLVKLYKGCSTRLKELYLYKLESCLKDIDEAIAIIETNKLIKDQIHKDNQYIVHPQYAEYRQQLKQDITQNTDKIGLLYRNFIDDSPIFIKFTNDLINTTLKQINSALEDFRTQIICIKEMA